MSEIKIPDLTTLRRIRATSNLSEGHLIALANQLRVLKAKKNQVLIGTGSNEKTGLYIIRGRVSLSAGDGRSRTVNVGEKDEIRPVAQLRPSIYQVTALGPVDYMKVDIEKLLEVADLSDSSLGEISVHSLFTNYDEEDSSIVNHLYRNLMNNSIRLPSLPSVAARIQKIYRGRATNVDAVVHTLISYPDVTRKLRNIARTNREDALSESEKIRLSIKRIGIRAVYCIVMTYAIGKLVKRMPEAHLQRVSSFWQHSLNVSAISRILARNTRLVSPDLAMLAGLLHGIGVLAIDDRLLEYKRLMLDHLEVDHAIQVMRPEISSLLLRKWNFADILIKVAEECGDWSRDHKGPADLCDIVLVANYYGMLHADVNHVLPRVDAVPAIRRIGIDPKFGIEAVKQAGLVKRNIKKLFV